MFRFEASILDQKKFACYTVIFRERVGSNIAENARLLAAAHPFSRGKVSPQCLLWDEQELHRPCR